MKLTAKAVQAIIEDCFFNEGEGRADAVITEGVIRKYGFHPGRLETHKTKIAELLAELPDNFQAGGGRGWSFLNACMDKHGIQWGEHNDIECLLALGIATDQAKILMPRDMWPSMPGGMPYFSVNPMGSEI